MTSGKKPYVKVSAGFYLKDAPKGQRSIFGEQWVFGNEPTPFGVLAAQIVYQLMKFYTAGTGASAAEMNAQIEGLRDALGNIKTGNLRG